MNFYFIQCVMILFYHYFDAKIFLVTDLTFQTGSFVLLTCPQSFCKNFPTFWDKKMFQAHLVFTLVQAWNQRCLQESFFVFFRGKWHTENKMWRLGMFISTEVSLRLSLCIYTHGHSIFFFLPPDPISRSLLLSVLFYFFSSVLFKNCKFILILLITIQHYKILFPPPLSSLQLSSPAVETVTSVVHSILVCSIIKYPL